MKLGAHGRQIVAKGIRHMKSIFQILAVPLIFAWGVTAVGREGKSAGEKATPGGFTIQKIMSAPFPSELVPAPVKGRFAWVFYAEGYWEYCQIGKSYAHLGKMQM